MRFNTGHAEVQAEGFAQQVSGKIAASGKAFKGLIDGLYSRKIEAVVRELSTNAFDAHKLAGFVGPFDVHLPSALDPVFRVRDYGPGMTHDFMLNRYPVLFDSTKDGLNPLDAHVDPDKQVGSLGLGRMSFFTYTDACTVTNWQDGEMRVYAVYMGGDGVIQIAHAGTVPSDEPNGVQIEFAVKVKDFQAFAEAGARVFKGFPIAPRGLSVDVLAAIQIEPQVMGKFWKSFPKDYLPGGGYYARQGCVLYPIDLVQVDGKAIEDEEGNVVLSSDFGKLANNDNTVIIDFPIGSIGFDLSRERLSYDEPTVKAIRKRWGQFTKDLQKQVTESFASLRRPHDRMKAALDGPMKAFGSLFGCSKEALDAEYVKAAIWQDFPESSVKAAEGVKPILHAIGNIEVDPLVQTPPHYRYSRQWNGPDEKDVVGAAFIYLDEKKPHEKVRIGLWMQANNIPWVFVIRPKRLTVKRWHSWGRPNITRMSDLPQPPKRAKLPRSSGGGGGGRGGVFDRFKLIHDRHDNYADVTSDASDFDMDDRYFALINKGQYVPADSKTAWMDLSDVMLLHRLVKRTQGIDITLINTRTNEPADKWDAYPKFDHLIESLVESLPNAFVKRFITVLNYQRFNESWYAGALSKWNRGNPTSDDPINALRRFGRRFKNMTAADQALFSSLVARCGYTSQWADPKMPQWEEIGIQIIERARAMGLEVLMPMGTNGARKKNVTDRILPKRWENIAKIAANPMNHHDRLFNLLLKEATSC